MRHCHPPPLSLQLLLETMKQCDTLNMFVLTIISGADPACYGNWGLQGLMRA